MVDPVFLLAVSKMDKPTVERRITNLEAIIKMRMSLIEEAKNSDIDARIAEELATLANLEYRYRNLFGVR